MFTFVKLRYRMHKMTAAEVWACADRQTITEAQAAEICGPRPEGSK